MLRTGLVEEKKNSTWEYGIVRAMKAAGKSCNTAPVRSI